MIYNAPVKDMMFLIDEWIGIDTLNSLPGYEEFDKDILEAVLEEAGKFCSTEVLPINRDGDEHGAVFADGAVTTPPGFKNVYQRFIENGWTSIDAEPGHGGQGLPKLVSFLIDEMLGATNLAFKLYAELSHGAYHLLAVCASEEIRAQYLPKMVEGVWSGTMCLTEPHCGSDLGMLTTKASPNNDGSYDISGTKIFITSGDHDLTENILHLVIARIDGAADGSRGISLFLVPKLLVNDESGARGDDVTLTGKGFQDGTTATIWLDVDADGTRDTGEITLASALVGSDDTFSVTVIVSNPPFSPGKGSGETADTALTTGTSNTWNAIDGQNNTLHCRSSDFTCPRFSLSDDIAVTPSSASIGDTVQIKATDFASGASLTSVTIGGIIVTGLPTVTMTTQGDATFNITIPNGVPSGTQEIKVFIGSGSDDAKMVISGADLSLTPDTNLVPNQTITVIGRGYSLGGGAKISGTTTDTSSILIDGSSIGLKASGGATTNKINEGNSITIDNGGNWSASIVLPINNTTVTPGTHELKITDDGGREGVGVLVIAPRTIILSPAESRVGTVVTVTGTGFPGDNTKTGAASTPSISIRYTVAGTAQTVATLTPDASGNILGTFTVPLNTAIPSTNSVTAEFNYRPTGDSVDIVSTTGSTHRIPRATVTIDPSEGPTGTTVSIIGQGFKTFSTVSALNIGDVDVRPAPVPSTDSEGSFTATILVPQLNTGSQSVTATVSNTVATDTFTVLSVAATATPAPVAASQAPADALAALISNNDNLQRVWHFDPSQQSVAPDFGWFLYDPRPVFAAANSVDEIAGGKFYWINVREAQTAILGGVSRSLFAGWNPVTW
ncbi:MAG: acyl-CoA dehydrogenase family protein [Proteobacteria bacterium]|nr:acyl-CoA dehydrogenase family protein [Pseudomonadota bacterium]